MSMRWLCFFLLFCLFPTMSEAESSATGLSSNVGYPHMAIVGGVPFFTAPDIPMSFQDTIYAISGEALIEYYSADHITAVLSYHNGLLVVLEQRSLMESIMNVKARSIRFISIGGATEESYLNLQLPESTYLWNVRYRNGKLYVLCLDSARQFHVLIYNDEGQQISHYSNTGYLYDTCFTLSRDDKYLRIYDIETGSVYETDVLQSSSMQFVSHNGFLYYTDQTGLHRYTYHTHVDDVIYRAEGINSSTNFIIYDNSVYILYVPDTYVSVLDLETMGITTISIPVYPEYAAIANDTLYIYERNHTGGIAEIDLNTLEVQVWLLD